MTDWQRDLEDARATIEELTRERDEAIGKVEHVLCCLRGQQQATKEAHVAIERQRSRAVKAERGRDDLRAKIAYLEPIVDAVYVWVETEGPAADTALLDAINSSERTAGIIT